MLIPPGLHFDPLAAAAAVDPTKIKKYDMPYKGQTFVQLHQGGTHVIVGTVVGFDFRMDRQGNLVEWRASIDCKLTNSFSFANGATWRDASEWHPAPAEQQESAGDGGVEGVRVYREELRAFKDVAEKDLAKLEALLLKISDRVEALLPLPNLRDDVTQMRVELDSLRVLVNSAIMRPPDEAPSAFKSPLLQLSAEDDVLGRIAPAAPVKQPLPRFGRKPVANDASK